MQAVPEPVAQATPSIVVDGTINAVGRPKRDAAVTHGPMPDIGMPGMTMHIPADPALDALTVPTGKEITLLLQ